MNHYQDHNENYDVTDYLYSTNQPYTTDMARGYSTESKSSTRSVCTASTSSPRGYYPEAWGSPISEAASDTGFVDPSMPEQENSYTTRNSDHWYNYYNFIVNVEPGQPPYWELKPGYAPTQDYPHIRPAEDLSSATPRSAGKEDKFLCLTSDCKASFARRADLERHYEQRHMPAESKPSYPCDRKKCPRTKPFHRLDHCREHYREFHREDLTRRSSSTKEDKQWWEDREIKMKWFRCTRCLTRVYIQEHGFDCPSCNTSLELERKRARGYQ
ncbi:hypothetical protein F5Y16DRAFT_245641 [Xylariaceae sp. FL0255]|nr:hypothetical protein F5Y16DRAFT_245641 [Xylariaceae sp. FL0255]